MYSQDCLYPRYWTTQPVASFFEDPKHVGSVFHRDMFSNSCVICILEILCIRGVVKQLQGISILDTIPVLKHRKDTSLADKFLNFSFMFRELFKKLGPFRKRAPTCSIFRTLEVFWLVHSDKLAWNVFIQDKCACTQCGIIVLYSVPFSNGLCKSKWEMEKSITSLIWDAITKYLCACNVLEIHVYICVEPIMSCPCKVTSAKFISMELYIFIAMITSKPWKDQFNVHMI